MVDFKHTPGPWVFYADLPSAEPDWHIVTTANKMRVLANVHIEPGNEMDEANARLIAAAPDLLSVALTLRDYISDAANGGLVYREGLSNGLADMAADDLARIDAAIARAKGGDA